MNSRLVLFSSALVVCLCTWGAPPATAAAVVAFASTTGHFDDRAGNKNTVFDQEVTQVSGAFVDAYTRCVGPVGSPCLDPSPPDPSVWYRQFGGMSAAAQAITTFGQNKVRSYAAGREFAQGFTEYNAASISRWNDEITYLGAVAAMVSFEVRLHGAWNDFGRFSLGLGVLRQDWDPELGVFQYLDGKNIYNCTEQDFVGLPHRCASALVPQFDPANNVFLSGFDPQNVNGEVDMFVTVSALFDPGETLTFTSGMRAYSGFESGAEVDAFNTVTLTRILLQPGGSISTGSGTAYNVEIIGDPNGVPEPHIVLLSALALAGATLARRRA
jgi:hypothetical protein